MGKFPLLLKRTVDILAPRPCVVFRRLLRLKCFGCSVLSVLTKYLSNRSQNVVVDGCLSNFVKVVSEFAKFFEEFAESLNRNLNRVSEWCDPWLMRLNSRRLGQ